MAEYNGEPLKFNNPCTVELSLYASKDGEDSEVATYLLEVVKYPSELSFTDENAIAYMDALDENKYPTLNNPHNLPVTYLSLEEKVATVDEQTGVVTLVAPGTTEIHAIFAGNDEFEKVEGGVYYTLTVEANKPNKTTSTFTFDFTTEDYGMTRYNSGNGSSADAYNPSPITIFNDEINSFISITATNGDNGKNRLWNTDGWKFHRGQKITGTSNYNSCTYTFEVASDKYDITSIKFDGTLVNSTKATVSAEGYDAQAKEWKGYSNSVEFTFETSDNLPIKTMVVTFEHDVVKMPKLIGGTMEMGLALTHENDDHAVFFKITDAYGNDVTDDRMLTGTAASAPARAISIDADHEGHTPYTAGSEFTMKPSDKLSTYAQHPHGMVSEVYSTTYEDIATGIGNIAADSETEVVYFNLQGVRVAEPTDGVYIRVENGKATKVIK